MNILHGTTAIQRAARTSSLITIMKTTDVDSDHVDVDFDEDLSLRTIMTMHLEQKIQDSQIPSAAVSANNLINIMKTSLTIMKTTDENSDHVDVDFGEDLSRIRKIMTMHMEQKRQDSQILSAAVSANDNANRLSDDEFIEEYFSDEEYEMPLNDTQAIGRHNSTTEANKNLNPQRGKSYYY
jgi:hypothetical protein